MPRIFSFLFKWSLEITGVSIIMFNYQPYQQQQKIIGMYQAALNSLRSTYHLYALMSELKEIAGVTTDSNEYRGKVDSFRTRSAETVKKLGQVNQGVYARMGQLMANMTGVLPEDVLRELRGLKNINVPELEYEQVRLALTECFEKPMKELFDGFQVKPFSRNLFAQYHRSILLQNYKQSLIKVILPSTQYQSEYDFLFLQKVVDHIRSIIPQNSLLHKSLVQYEKILQTTKKQIESQLNLEKEYETNQQLQDLMYQQNSEFYIPYYYKKYLRSNIIIREWIEGCEIGDQKGLSELGLKKQQVYGHMMNQVKRMMTRFGLVQGMGHKKMLIRKYIIPAKRKQQDDDSSSISSGQRNKKGQQTKLIHPKYQVVLLNLNNLQQIDPKIRQEYQQYWLDIQKSKKNKIIPSVTSFYNNLKGYKNNQDNQLELLSRKYYLYQPLIAMYERFITGGTAAKK